MQRRIHSSSALVLLVTLLTSTTLIHASSLTTDSIPASSSESSHSSPIATPSLTSDGLPLSPSSNPVVPNGILSTPGSEPKPIQKYTVGTDFLGAYGGVPINPTAHLQKSLAEDKLYIASILRAPLDLGDPTDCKHSDIVKDELELKKIALRINHRRVSLRQQQMWIDSAKEGLQRIEEEIKSTTSSARNLAEQLDSLQAQKEDITNHVHRSILLKELDRTTSNLMRLKNSRMKEEVRLQKKHNTFALKNADHNSVLNRLNTMRTRDGLALGKLPDPKPYRFQQVKGEAAAEEGNAVATESDAQAEAATSAEQEKDQSNVEVSAETEAESESENESDAAAEDSNNEESQQSEESETEKDAL